MSRSVESVLGPAEWQARSRAHLERVQRYTRPYRERRSRRESHPVHDFLFQYYNYSAGKLEAWHPDPDEALVDTPEARELFDALPYRASDGVIRRDRAALAERDLERMGEVVRILVSTRERPANFGCFGVHEWAMVYGGHDVRHEEVAPLRLAQDQVDAFVESRPVACSHFDAFRFFAPEAKPLNRLPLEWATRHEMEQPGCIHANMDLYRWAYTSMPWIGSDLLRDCFELAIDLRVLDMRASPYDLRAIGFEPVRVETPDGRDEYRRSQRSLSRRAHVLRNRLIDVVGRLIGPSTGPTGEQRSDGPPAHR